MPSDKEHNSEDDSKEESGSVPQPASSGKEAMTKRRTKTGCLTCRKRRIKCGEERPICKNCVKSKRECAGYNHPLIYKQHGHTNPQSVATPPLRIEQGWSHAQINEPGNILTYVDFMQQSGSTQSSGREGLHRDEARQWSTNMNHFMLPQAEPHSMAPVGGLTHSDHPQWSPPWHRTSNKIISAPLPVAERPSSFSDLEMLPFNMPAINTTQESEGNIAQPQAGNLSSVAADHNRYSTLGFVQRPSFTSSIKLSPGPSQRIHGRSIMLAEEYEDPDDPWDVDMNEHDDERANLAHGRLPSSVHMTLSDQYQALAHQQGLSELSPLLEEKSQKIFRHFIAVTGPCMGTFDRHDGPNSNGMPKMIWTHGLPAMAFKFPALAHAILAISAMHMFKLNSGSENTAVKHFTYALRRVGKALANPHQRLEVSTLATVLLLGYFEVMAGDHSRWNLHLSGAGKLMMEHNYAGMIRVVRKNRVTAKTNIAQPQIRPQPTSQDEYVQTMNTPVRLFDDNDCKVDQELISKLMGFDVDYDSQKQPKFEVENSTPGIDQKNIDDWRVLTELYWWYCRQDVFMSMLSGDPLLLPYSHWKYCSPRGPIGNANNLHTTFDHMWLIIARLTDFGGKDRKRKQRLVNTQGGQWIPAPGFFESMQSPGQMMPGSTEKNVAQMDSNIRKLARPSANEGRARTAKQSPGMTPSQPSFYGMLPPAPGPIHMPSSFNIMKAELRGSQGSSPIDAESPQAQDLETQTRLALEEHASIIEAFDIFESYLGSDFQPLTSSDIQITTPFGSALQYKTPRIAVLWTYYYVGRILLRRMHPHSPPAAMVSAGVNARATHEYAQAIGRICGGLIAQHSYLLQTGHVNPMLSAAVMETTFSLLFAAVQYHDPVQRGWTISKLSEIAQQTGWQTSAAVAAACESMWEKAGLAGKGPPYQRTLDRNNADARLNVQLRSAQEHVSPTINLSAAEEHESRFVSHDRNLIDRHASTRAHWALGLLSVEEDLQRISLSENE